MSDFINMLGMNGVSSVLRAVVVFLICLIAIRLLMKVINLALDKSRHIDSTLKSFLRTALRIALWALAVVVIAETLGIPTASLVTVLGIAGLALSLSIQNIMANIFSGITLLITRPFNVGDYITVGEQGGTVRSVGLFYTVIVTYSNQVISLPNADVTSSPITNMGKLPMTATRVDPALRRIDLRYSASYDDSTESVRTAILDAAAGDARILQDPKPAVFVSNYGESAIEYTLWIWCKAEDYWGVYYGMNERVRDSFGKFGVTMTYNHLNVHITQ